MQKEMNRRKFIAGLGAAGVLGIARPARMGAAAPTAPVAVAKCRTYDAFLPVAEKAFDQLGGLGRLVRGKTVAIKVNMTGDPNTRLGHVSAGRSFWTHPHTVGAVIHLLDNAGAHRIRVLEGAMSWPDSLEEFMYRASWDIRPMLNAGRRVELVNTNLPYKGKKPYTRFEVPNGGHLFSAYELNTAYSECDVLVTMSKLKEHLICGVTLSIKNSFGITPCTIYGGSAGIDEPLPIPYGGRQEILHNGSRQPAKIAPAENDPQSPRQPGYRVPRAIADLVAARPVHLAILDGIETMAGGEGPWGRSARPCSPGVVVFGTNVVTTDAVSMSVLGFDPMADRGTAPFERCDSALRLAEEHGVGTRDLSQIEVIGPPIDEIRFPIREVPGGLPPGPVGRG